MAKLVWRTIFWVWMVFLSAACAQAAPAVTEAPTVTELPAATDVPLSEPAAAALPGLVVLYMQDTGLGWGLGEGAILRTESGGAQWKNVSPPDGFGPTLSLHAFFLDASTGWVLAPSQQAEANARIFHTRDGGKSWQSFETPFISGQVFFVDAQNGWVLNASDCGAGSCGGLVYRSQDGGVHWTQVSQISPNPTTAASLPFDGIKNGISFRDPATGWVGGTEPQDGYVWLFRTQDSGQTWQHQDLPLPSGFQTATLSVNAPVFFSAQEGLLAVDLFTSGLWKVLYHSGDGGQTWTASTPLSSAGLLSCVSARLCWVWDGIQLAKTEDAGQTWTQTTSNLDLSQVLVQVQFVDASTAWALTLDSGGHSQLYKTVDGGLNWGVLIP